MVFQAVLAIRSVICSHIILRRPSEASIMTVFPVANSSAPVSNVVTPSFVKSSMYQFQRSLEHEEVIA